MKKKVLILLTSIMMIFACVPAVNGLAAGNVAKIVETGISYGTVQEAINAAENGQTVQMIADSTENVMIESSDKSVILDLNGYVLSGDGKGSVIINNGALTITDSNSSSQKHYFKVDSSGLWVMDDSLKNAEYTYDVTNGLKKNGKGTSDIPAENAAIRVSGGIITGGEATAGGGVYNEQGSSFIVSGGDIVGCKATGSRPTGGGVYGYEASITISGGAVIGCTSSNTGGGIHNYNGMLTLKSGSISYCKTSGFGFGLIPQGGGVYNTGTFTMTGGSIIGCSSSNSSAGVHNQEGTFVMEDGIISGCSAPATSGVCNYGSPAQSSTFKMSGGVISGCTNTSGNLGCVGINSSSSVVLGGTAKITGNKAGTGETAIASNIHLPDGVLIDMGTGTGESGNGVAIPAAGMSIGVSLGTEDGKGAVTSEYTGDCSGYFSSDANLGVYSSGTAADKLAVYIGKVVAQIGETKYATVQEAINAAENGQTVKMIADSTENVTVGTSTDRSKNITLDLNGKTLSSTGTVETVKHNAITNHATLTIADSSTDKTGKITGGTGSVLGRGSCGGGIYNTGGTLTLTGGTITGNSATLGAGVANVNNGDAKGTFIMTGGTITGNASSSTDAFAGGGGVYNDDTFIMSGGTISGNSAANVGGGVLNKGTMKVSGTAKISDNTNGAEEKPIASNVHLPSGKTITVGTGSGVDVKYLEKGASIGVTLGTDDGTGAVTDTNSTDYHEYFISDNADLVSYNDKTSDTNQVVKLGVHLHKWEYSLSKTTSENDTIESKCKGTFDTCSYRGTDLSITIIAPSSSDLTYNGEKKEATLSAATLIGETAPTISYEYKATAAGTYASTTDLTKAGYYKASITVGENDGKKTAYVEYVVKKADITVTADNKEMKLGEKVPAFTATVTGLIGKDTVSYTLKKVQVKAQGVYSIVPEGKAEQGNYAVTYVQGLLVVSKAEEVAKANTEDLSTVLKELRKSEEYKDKTLDIELRTSEDVSEENKQLIAKQVSPDKKILYIDADLFLLVTEDGITTEENFGDRNNNLIRVTYKFDFRQKSDVQILRVHEADDGTVTVDELKEAPNADGEFVEFDTKKGVIVIYAKKYSTFSVAYKEVTVPSTGDRNNASFYMILGLLSLMAGAGATIGVSKKAKRQ